jgi:chromosomal replication initiation ATPase DnaA
MESTAVAVRAEGLAETILAKLQERIGPRKFKAWFTHGTRVSVENGQVKVAVPNEFVANWIETHYQGEIAAAAQESHESESPAGMFS